MTMKFGKCKYFRYGFMMDDCVNKNSKNFGKDNYYEERLPCNNCQDYERRDMGKIKKVQAWILTDNKEYFQVWMKKPPDGFSNTYKRFPCTIIYKVENV